MGGPRTACDFASPLNCTHECPSLSLTAWDPLEYSSHFWIKGRNSGRQFLVLGKSDPESIKCHAEPIDPMYVAHSDILARDSERSPAHRFPPTASPVTAPIGRLRSADDFQIRAVDGTKSSLGLAGLLEPWTAAFVIYDTENPQIFALCFERSIYNAPRVF